MPAAVSQSKHDIDSILKRVDTSIREFSEGWQRAKVEVTSRDIQEHHAKLKKLRDVLQQHDSQLLSLGARGAMRRAQKEKMEAMRASIDHELQRFNFFEQELNDVVSKAAAICPDCDSDSDRCKVEENKATTEAPAEQKDVKVQWDQLVRESADDNEMLDEFVCKICQVHVVGCGPKLARCSHLFCGDCISKWFETQPQSLSWAQRAQAAGTVPCPVCKEPLNQSKDLFPVCAAGRNESALLWRLLSGVKIVCANHSRCRDGGRCTWTGEYGDYQRHIATCANVPLDDMKSAGDMLDPPRSKVCDDQDQCTSNPSLPAQNEHHSDAKASDARVAKDLEVQEAQPLAQDKLTVDASHLAESEAAATQTVETNNLTGLIVELMDHERKNQVKNQSESDVVAQLPQPDVQQTPASLVPAARIHRAILPFKANDSSQLEVSKGEILEVLDEQPSGWTYGRKVSQASSSPQAGPEGWFPHWVLE